MSDLAKLARKAKKEKVMGIDITIMPIGMTDMELFENKDQPQADGIKTTREIILKSIPGSTEEEIDNMSIEYMASLQDAIMRVNNISKDKLEDVKAKFLAETKKEQDAKSA